MKDSELWSAPWMCELVRYKIRSVQNLVKTFCFLGNSELVPVWARYKRLLTYCLLCFGLSLWGWENTSYHYSSSVLNFKVKEKKIHWFNVFFFFFNVRFGACKKDFSHIEYWPGTKSSGPPAQSSTPVASSFWNRGVWSVLPRHCCKGIRLSKFLSLVDVGGGQSVVRFVGFALFYLLYQPFLLFHSLIKIDLLGEKNHYLNPHWSKLNSLFSLCMYSK